MSVSPKVSVIVPVFNTGEKLVPTIDSLLSQTLKDIEIILVNDDSTDDSGTVIDRLASDNAKIMSLHLPENKGVHEARLAGLELSTAPWIGFLDADDFARPNMFATMLSAAENNDVDIAVCSSDRVTPERKVIAPKLRFPRSEKVSVDVFEHFCKFDFGTGTLWNKLFKRSVIEPWFDLHFPWRQSINEDLLLNIGCFHNAKSVYLLHERLHEYVLVDSSVTTQMQNCWAYVETFRAYALAVTCYQRLGKEAVMVIIDMYRTQISWGTYQVEGASMLTKYKEQLHEATCLLSKENPYALAAIVARPQNMPVGGRLAIKSLFLALTTRLKTLF
jgi:glycosyltransferase involved in cell wall biosynthesis